jgi:methylmalonyl-CoA mutase cobalamin-binding domain/chain
MNVPVVKRSALGNSAGRRSPVRILTAVPICDGHDSAIITINLELVRAGIEVIYLGYHRSTHDIVRAAIQEDVQAIGLSSYNGGHVEFFSEVMSGLSRAGARDIGVFGGGGGTITPADAKLMKRRGVDEIFFAGTLLNEMVEWVKRTYRAQKNILPAAIRRNLRLGDRELSESLTAAERGGALRIPHSAFRTLTIGLTGPGGAGKTTLIDELTLRFLQALPRGRLAILSHDPSAVGKGAFLGDRATMIYAQDDRVFMRSLATRSRSGGLSTGTRSCLELLSRAGFDLVLVESAGIGQEDSPFARELVDKQIFVTSPEYGGRLQLQKIVMLDVANIVVVNKADRPGAKTALAEIEQRLAMNRQGQKLLPTITKRHGDPGVDQLFREMMP